jgi:hypothetical protein
LTNEILDTFVGLDPIKGRCFTDGDRIGTLQAVVVNESYVHTHFPNEDPLGKGVNPGGLGPAIIGVVGDVRQFGPKSLTEPLAYFSYLQLPKACSWRCERAGICAGGRWSD